MARPPIEPLLAAPQKALKEWAVVCRALQDGTQSVLLRKVPTAYLTGATGPAGWREAILGTVEC